MAEQKFKRDYSNKKVLNGNTCKAGEVLVPYRVDEEMIKTFQLDQDVLETWVFGGKKVRVGFIPVNEDIAEQMMKFFWKDLNEYLEKFRKKRCYIPNGSGALVKCPRERDCSTCKYRDNPNMFTSITLSLDKMMEDIESDNGKGIDPTGTTANEDKVHIESILYCILDELRILDERYPEIFSLHYEGNKKGDILKTVNLGVAKSQGYAIIDKVIEAARKIYNEKYK